MGAVVVGCATRATRSWLEARRPASCASPVRWQQPALANELVRALLFVRIFLLSCVRFRELFLLLWCQATVCAWRCGPARVLPAARAAAATPRRATSRCRAAFLVSPKAKSRGDWPNRFFFELFLEI